MLTVELANSVSGKGTLNNGVEGVADLVNSSGLPVTVS
jgi:hypothetical protein